VQRLELALARNAGFSTSVAVVASAPTAAPAAETVQPVQVLRTPGALDNIYRTLQTLPGVAPTDEFGSRLSVRGGAPDQNLTMMDGVEVHDPFRLFGLTSAFNPETIQRFELATGGFSVKYGDRLSSLLVVENRDGRSGGMNGSASLSVTDTNTVFEGGLPGGQKGSWLVTGRRTYYDLVASRITGQDFPQFQDLQSKVTWAPSGGTRLSAFGMISRQAANVELDSDDARGEFQDDTDNDLAWLRLDQTLGTRGQSRTILGYSDTRSTLGVDAAFQNARRRSNSPAEEAVGLANVVFERSLGVKDVSLRQEFTASAGIQGWRRIKPPYPGCSSSTCDGAVCPGDQPEVQRPPGQHLALCVNRRTPGTPVPRVHRHHAAWDPRERDDAEVEAATVVPPHHAGIRRARRPSGAP